MLKIIKPAHNLPASEVKNWKEIKDDARALKELVARGFDGDGNYPRAYAVSHAQVSNDPKHFFVINETLDDEDGKNLSKKIGSWCIVNAQISETDTLVEWKEACMSFQHRSPKIVNRFFNIKVRYQVPVLGRFLMWRTRRFRGLPAFLFQHEQEHSLGGSIYFPVDTQKNKNHGTN